MKSADEYAELAVSELSNDGHDPLAYHAIGARVYATLALAAATLEAARLMGPTPEDQARLDALGPKPLVESDRYDDGSLRPQWG